ncbi:MAG TPA: hypothetical protein VI796_04375 [Candidatus Thermoplasmatota archaeon]|nr:hypothetical protein [Candidatus Thermoplasmatota archaeon]
MRLLLAAALVALSVAGCAATDDKAEDPLFGLCPSWIQGPGRANHPLALSGPGSEDWSVQPPGTEGQDPGSLAWLHNGDPFDLVRVRVDNLTLFHGSLELRAFVGDRQPLIRDFREESAQLRPVVVLDGVGDDGQEFDVLLTGISEGEPAAPGPVRLEWRLEPTGTGVATASLDALATFHYRVCGA